MASNSEVGTVSAASVGFDVNDDRIFEIPGVAVKEQGNRSYHLFQYLVDKQYPFAITNGDRSQIMVYSPDRQISTLKDAFDWKVKAVSTTTDGLNSNGIRLYSKSAKNESGGIQGSVPKDAPTNLIHQGGNSGDNPLLWRTQGCTAKRCSGEIDGDNRPAGSLVMNDDKDADGYIRMWRNNGFIALLTAEDGTPYFGLVSQDSVYENPEVEKALICISTTLTTPTPRQNPSKRR
ncbi:hypothetical protein [Bifidobacterium magnum]|uniref:Uncharacterized protein n=1 Tax=Bifidobacterium magnum TaxID=1692 RepID=A0A087BC87_9BIFI|nr:hypothetical protein [Bifidobacterium magnum]KFI68637.1 hypothetical protein BMAGN_0503 [Bifidobacterium magnum]